MKNTNNKPEPKSKVLSGIIAAETAVYEKLESLVGEDAKKAVRNIRQHSYISAICGTIIIVPGVDVFAFVVNTWTMYGRINTALGISLGKNAIKSVALAIATNMLSIIPATVLVSMGGSILKIIPGLGTAGGIMVTCVTFYTLSSVMGWTYLKAIMFLVGSDTPINGRSLKMATKQIGKDKDLLDKL